MIFFYIYWFLFFDSVTHECDTFRSFLPPFPSPVPSHWHILPHDSPVLLWSSGVGRDWCEHSVRLFTEQGNWTVATPPVPSPSSLEGGPLLHSWWSVAGQSCAGSHGGCGFPRVTIVSFQKTLWSSEDMGGYSHRVTVVLVHGRA